MEEGGMTLTEFLERRFSEDLEALVGAFCECDPNEETGPECAPRIEADIAAKRRVIADYPEGAARWLATVYAWHPDYRQEWRP
jgi:hypothetical protein